MIEMSVDAMTSSTIVGIVVVADQEIEMKGEETVEEYGIEVAVTIAVDEIITVIEIEIIGITEIGTEIEMGGTEILGGKENGAEIETETDAAGTGIEIVESGLLP
mmetsp:Transcript_28902/g.48546  ORF Transcript_28902/g.48546 Transcript_28902/m.48546 type:complete len:105 (+) Transcript_28902:186-500(+)